MLVIVLLGLAARPSDERLRCCFAYKRLASTVQSDQSATPRTATTAVGLSRTQELALWAVGKAYPARPMSDRPEPARALLVDFGGVLTTDVFRSFREFSEQEGLEPDAVKRLFSEDPDARDLLRALERGEVEEDEFEPRFATMLGVEDPDDLIDRMFAGMDADEAMTGAVREARAAGVRTGLLSNSWGAGRYDRSRFDELFDTVVISGEVGLRKPEPEIFTLAVERVGLPATTCVFVDDLRDNCAAAEEAGMTAVLHLGAATTVPELERLLGVALRRS